MNVPTEGTIDYKKAFEKAIWYLEKDVGCCPAYYDWCCMNGKCINCVNIEKVKGEEGYKVGKSFKCWQDVFLKGTGNSEKAEYIHMRMLRGRL